MKKIILVVVLLSFVYLLFADPVMRPYNMGMKAPDGSSPGETIDVQCEYYNNDEETVEGVAYSGGNLDKILVFYYSADPPTTESYLGLAGVSVSNFSNSSGENRDTATFDFTLPTYSGAESFQLGFAMYWEDFFGDPVLGSKRCSYITAIGWSVCSETPPSGWDAYFTYDDDTPTPVELSTFSAIYEGQPRLFWTTQSELDNQGWNIYRANSQDDVFNESYFKINSAELIEGAGTASEETNYVFTDEYDVEINETYYYILESRDLSGVTQLYGPISLAIPELNEDPIPPNTKITILRNSPNPFYLDQTTDIYFSTTDECFGNLTIYNLKGEKVKTLHEGSIDQRQYIFYPINWDGKDSSGKPVNSGIYFYTLDTNIGSYTKKLIVLP